MSITDIPDDLKQRMRDAVVDIVARQAEKMPEGDKAARIIRQLSSQALFYNAFDKAMISALERYRIEYTAQDEDLVEVIINDGEFWQSKDVRQALMTMISRPGAWLVDERVTVTQHFMKVLPKRINRERVDKAVTFLLGCVVEELWTLPGVSEIREIYNLQFQKINAEAARQQVALAKAQLQATAQQNEFNTDIRQALLQLATTLEHRLLAPSPPQPTLPSIRPYHNLFQPDYTRFVGRKKELDWLHQHLSPHDRVWQMVITGIGGVGKSSLALAIAQEYCERYNGLSSKERFEAIIWVTAKEEILTIKGREKSTPAGLIFRTLEDMYSTIAQTLERVDITRAGPEEQDRLVQKALSAQRTLLIVDNLDSVIDERVHTFLYTLPVPTKCIITSREWIDVAAVLRLTGLLPEEAELLIAEEAMARTVKLNPAEQEQLFRRTSGLPLPIKLSIARMASGETLDQVMRWLGNATGDLPEYCVKGQIDLARQYDPNAWKLLLACSLFDQDASILREALGFIADLSLADRDDGLTLLQRLCLLNRDGGEQFWILPMVHGYMRTELGRADFAEMLTERWLDWLLEFTKKCRVDLELHTGKAQLIGSEYSNLLSAIRWCREHERWETLLQLTEETWVYPYLVNLFSDLQEILEAAVSSAKALLDEQREERFIRRQGQLLWLRGQHPKALERLEKAEEIAFRYKDDIELGRIGDTRSAILSGSGHLLEARQIATTVLGIGEQYNNLELKILAVYRLAELEFEERNFDKTLKWLEQGEKWCRELDWAWALAWNMCRQGSTLILQGNPSAAEGLLQESLNLATSYNGRRLIACNKRQLAQVYVSTNRLQLARQMAEDARDLYERIGLVQDLAEAKEFLRKLLKRDGNE